MSRLGSWAKDALWPDVETELGAVSARRMAAISLFVAYLYCNSSILFANSDRSQIQSAANSLTTMCGIAAAIYLALRIRNHGCDVAAWAGFLWLGYQAIDRFMESAISYALVLCVMMFFSFQGLRACAQLQDSRID